MAREFSRSSGGGIPKGGGATEEEAVADYAAPKFDQGRIKALTAEQMAPAVGIARRGIKDVQAGRYANPKARREAISGAIEGAGRLITGAQGTAASTATSLYQPEYQAKLQESILNYKKTLAEAERARQEEERLSSPTSGGGRDYGESYASAQNRLNKTVTTHIGSSPSAPSRPASSPISYTNQLLAGTSLDSGSSAIPKVSALQEPVVGYEPSRYGIPAPKYA